MRCPECGFHSFDYLDTCKKCGADLAEFKQRLGLTAHVPAAAPAAAPFAAPVEEAVTAFPESDEPGEEEIDFGFDILEEESRVHPQPFGEVPVGEGNSPALPDDDFPTAVALAGTNDLDFDNPFTGNDDFSVNPSFPGGGKLDLEQPFPEESEQLPDDDLPKLDDRF